MSLDTIVIAENPVPDYLRRYYFMRAAAERLEANTYEDQAAAQLAYETYASEIQEGFAIFHAFERQVQSNELVRDLPLGDARMLIRESTTLDTHLAEAVAYNKHVGLVEAVALFNDMFALTFNDTAQSCARALLNRFENLESYLWLKQYHTQEISQVDPEVFDLFSQEAHLLLELREEIFTRHLRLLQAGALPFAYQLSTLNLFSFDMDTDLLVESFSLFDKDVRDMFVGRLLSYVNAIPDNIEDANQGMFRAHVELLLFRLTN